MTPVKLGSQMGVRHESCQSGCLVLPVGFEFAADAAATEGDDCVCAAPRQNMPDCLSREPITALHPASMTPEPTKRSCFRNSGYRMRFRLLSKHSASLRMVLMSSGF